MLAINIWKIFEKDLQETPQYLFIYLKLHNIYLSLTPDLSRCRFQQHVIFKFTFCKICTSGELGFIDLIKNLLLFKIMIGVMRFNFCDC